MFRLLTRVEFSGPLFAIALLASYGVVPAIVDTVLGTTLSESLVTLCLIATAGVLVGFAAPLFDWMHSPKLPHLRLQESTFLWAVWIPFVLFVFIAWITAPQVPL